MFSVSELLQCNRRWEIVSIRNLAPNSGHLTEASLMFSGITSYSCALESSGARCAAFTVAGNANSTIDCHERWYFRSREVVRCAAYGTRPHILKCSDGHFCVSLAKVKRSFVPLRTRYAGSMDHVCAEIMRTTACVQTFAWMPFLSAPVIVVTSWSELP